MAVTDLADVPTTDATSDPPASPAPLAPLVFEAGDKVEVRRRFDDKWARGFEVVDATDAGYRLRRLSDGVELPATFPTNDVRKERKREFWWY